MGANGIFGFIYKGKYYLCYHHSDPDPDSLGVTLILEILSANLAEWKALLENIKIIDKKTKVTKAIALKLAKYADLTVSNQTPKEWYCLLRYCQGSFHHVLHSGYLDNCVDKNGKPEFQDFGYILNFDNDTFEFYKGHSKPKITPLGKLEDLLEKWQKFKITAAQKNYDPELELDKKKIQKQSRFQLMYANVMGMDAGTPAPTAEDIVKFFPESDQEEVEEEKQPSNNTKSSTDSLDYSKALGEPNYKRKVSVKSTTTKGSNEENEIFQSLVAKIMKGSKYQELLEEAKEKGISQTVTALVDNKTKLIKYESDAKKMSQKK